MTSLGVNFLQHYLRTVSSEVPYQIAELCADRGITDVIICPGSRSAPLALAFLRSKRFTCRTFSDERSAAFVAVGMAQQTSRTVVLICTSGSAGYNFAPAVAEAFYQQIPLLVLTADRPREWVDQLDGQTIRQSNLYGSHVKKSFDIPQGDGHPDTSWFSNRSVNEAISLADAMPQGPVHINIPFREPLYPSKESTNNGGSHSVRTIVPISSNRILGEAQWETLVKTISQFKKILVVPGQYEDPGLAQVIQSFQRSHPWAFAGDILSNFHSLPFYCRRADTYLGQLSGEDLASLRPELLITFGKSLVAKNLKLFLRKNPAVAHWHIHEECVPADTFQSLTNSINTSPRYFFEELTKRLKKPVSGTYADVWSRYESKAEGAVTSFFRDHHDGEFAFLQKVMSSLPDSCNLHLANSMSVRYANHIGLMSQQKGIRVFSNRGTSGIDGCTSTVLGHALASSTANVLITGDQAFFYDRNAFWHNYLVPNLFVVVLNNHGGIIFNMIDGPAGLPEAEEFFVTRQALNAKPLATEFGLAYFDGAKASLQEFFKAEGQAKILEFESTQKLNTSIFEAFRKHIKKTYEA